jgi:soluble lytic murein transglycosylase-like protein
MLVKSGILCALLGAAMAPAAEYAILQSGFRILVDRHERQGDLVRLYVKDGFTELPAGQVMGFEAEDYVPPPPPSPSVLPGAPASQAPPLTVPELVTRAAERNGLPPAIVHSVARAESAYRADAVSPKGAMGVMQLMPATAALYAANPADPEQNIEAGTRYLKDLLLKYMNHEDQVRLALAAYNAGPGAVDKYKGVPPYRETQNYVERVIREYRQPAK